jgi:hypothetical protein
MIEEISERKSLKQEIPKEEKVSKQEKYDLIKELGPRNIYDVLAGKAQIIGSEYRNRALINLGKELGKLIQQIPYNDDRFYRVIVKAKEVENLINQLQQSELTYEKLRENEWGGWEYSFIRDKEGRYKIVLDNWRTWPGTCYSETHDQIEKIMKTRITEGLREKKTTYTLDGTNWTESYKYLDDNDELIIEKIYHTHEDGYAIGLAESYFFKTKEDAEKCWKEIVHSFQEAKKEDLKSDEKKQT